MKILKKYVEQGMKEQEINTLHPSYKLHSENDWKILGELFWDYVKKRDWENSHVKKFTLIEVLQMIEDKKMED